MLVRTRAVFRLGLIIPHYWGKTFLAFHPKSYKFWGFRLAWRTNHFTWVPGIFSNLFQGILFLPVNSFLTCMHWSLLRWITRWDPLPFSGVLCVIFSSLVLFPVNSVLVFSIERSSCQLKELARFCPVSSFLHHSLETLSRR